MFKSDSIKFLLVALIKTTLPVIALIILCLAASWGTGFYGDDFSFFHILKKKPSLLEAIFNNWATGGSIDLHPVFSIFLKSFFYLFGDFYIFVFLTKGAINFFLVYPMYLFLNNFFQDKNLNLILALVVIFLPNHDSVNYWIFASFYGIPQSFFILAFLNRNKSTSMLKFFTLSLIGFFSGYSSFIFVPGFSYLLYREKKIKHLLLFLTSGLFYLKYFFMAQDHLNNGPGVKIDSQSTTIYQLIKNISLQLLTSLDAIIGPSFWLKTLGPLLDNPLLATFLSSILFLLIYKTVSPTYSYKPSRPFLNFACLTWIGSLFTFALTGRYPQIAFNLGNRATFFSALLIPLLSLHFLSKMSLKKTPFRITIIFFLSLITSSIVLTSLHWKKWTKIQENSKIQIGQLLDGDKTIPSSKSTLILGPQSSQIWGIDHIEFLSSDIAYYLLPLAKTKNHPITHTVSNRGKWDSLNQTYELIDARYSILFPALLIDLFNNKLQIINEKDMVHIQNILPNPIRRHWVCLLPQSAIQKFKLLEIDLKIKSSCNLTAP